MSNFHYIFALSGEVELSYGFDGRGRIVTGGKEEAFGEPFTEGDVIGCYAVSFKMNYIELISRIRLEYACRGVQCLSLMIKP